MGNVVLSNFTKIPFHENLSRFMGSKYEDFRPKIDKIFDKLEKGRITEKEFWQKLFQIFKIPSKKNYKNFLTEEFRDNWTLNKGTVKIAKSVQKSGYKIAILSNTIDPHVKYLKKKGWYKPFSILVLSSEVGMKKPKIGIYKLTLKKLKVKANESIFIDNKKKNLIPAKKLGMKTIHFRNAKQLETELKNMGIL